MSPSRRFIFSLLSAAGAGLASLNVAGAKGAANPTAPEGQVDALVRQSTEANAALMRGDIKQYLSLVAFTDDFTLMSPFGGALRRGSSVTPEKLEAMGRFFRNGTLGVEVVETYGSADMIVLVLIEHAHVEVGGLPAQAWSLRVTLVYRREGAEWRLAHRHADPLAAGISLQQSAALASGTAP
jgi:ketosteroid isomerase-like protein